MSRRLNARHIEAFYAVMLTGTTTAAAHVLHTTQPAISRTLAQLQATSGIRLFEMRRGRLMPTPEAKGLFDAVQKHFLGLDQIERTLITLKRSGMGLLRVACTPVLGLAVMPAVVQSFQRDHAGVRISLHTIDTHLMRDGLLSGLYDLALSTTDLSAVGLKPVPLHETRSVCVMAKSHPLASRREVRAEDLGAYPLLAHHANDTLQQKLTLLLKGAGIVPATVVETNYSATICAMAAAGSGIGIVSPYAASVFGDIVHSAPFSPALVVETQMAYAPQIVASRLAIDFAKRLGTYLDSRETCARVGVAN